MPQQFIIELDSHSGRMFEGVSQVTTLPGPRCAEVGGVAPGQVSTNTHTLTL